jgi:hypothetical protein
MDNKNHLYIDKNNNNNNPEINTCTIFKRTWKMKGVRRYCVSVL